MERGAQRLGRLTTKWKERFHTTKASFRWDKSKQKNRCRAVISECWFIHKSLRRYWNNVLKTINDFWRLNQPVVIQVNPCFLLKKGTLLFGKITQLFAAVKAKTVIDYVTLEIHIRTYYLTGKKYFFLSIRHHYQYFLSAADYVLRSTGISKLLARPADATRAVICAAYDFLIYQANPALDFQIERIDIYCVHAPIQVSSAPLSRSKLDDSKLLKKQQTNFLQHRIYSQIHTIVQFLYDACNSKRRKTLIVQDFYQ